MTPAELPAAFYDHLVRTVSADGWRLAPGWILDPEGKLTVMAMDLAPDQIYSAMALQTAKLNATAFVFAIDRYGKPGQGTTRSDLLAGHVSTDGPRGVRPFIVEYDPANGVVDPMNYDNAHWNAALKAEFDGVMRSVAASL